MPEEQVVTQAEETEEWEVPEDGDREAELERDYKRAVWIGKEMRRFHAWCGTHRQDGSPKLWHWWRLIAQRKERVARLKEIGAVKVVVDNEEKLLKLFSEAFLATWLLTPTNVKKRHAEQK